MARPVGDDHRNRNTTIPRRKTVSDKRVCKDRQKQFFMEIDKAERVN